MMPPEMLWPSYQLSAVVEEVSKLRMSTVRGKLPSQGPFLMSLCTS